MGFLDRFGTTLRFLTRIPWRSDHGSKTFSIHPEQLPIAGALIGLILSALWLSVSHLPPLVRGSLLAAFWVALTGGLHLDGWADTWEGALSAGPMDEKARIRKDPHLGSYAVLALVFLPLLKVSCLSSWHYSFLEILAVPILSRGFLPLSMRTLLYLSPKTSLSSGLGSSAWMSFRGSAFVVGIILSGGAGALLLGLAGMLFVVAGWVAWVLFALWVLKNSDSLSGDFMGWSIEGLELVLLLALGIQSIARYGF